MAQLGRAAVLASRAAGVPLVVDPVMYAKGGAQLLDPATGRLLKARLLAHATIVTPNIPEAAHLAEMKIASVEQMVAAGRALAAAGPKAVLVKGGHLAGPTVSDVLVTDEQVEVFESPRIDTRHTHGTGCTLASAIATGIAQGMALPAAVRRARQYVLEAIQGAPGFGSGHGPLNHGHTVRPFGVDPAASAA